MTITFTPFCGRSGVEGLGEDYGGLICPIDSAMFEMWLVDLWTWLSLETPVVKHRCKSTAALETNISLESILGTGQGSVVRMHQSLPQQTTEPSSLTPQV